ncbi:SDR family NAD(P)-dependent oxidoreductase [Streptomyces asiaticus]
MSTATRLTGGYEHDATGVRGDVGDLKDLDRLAETVAATSGRVDMLFAGADTWTRDKPIGQVAEESFDKVFAVNVRGTLFTVRKLLPLMSDGESTIVNGSGTAAQGSPGTTAYAASITARTRPSPCSPPGRLGTEQEAELPVDGGGTQIRLHARHMEINQDAPTKDREGSQSRRPAARVLPRSGAVVGEEDDGHHLHGAPVRSTFLDPRGAAANRRSHDHRRRLAHVPLPLSVEPQGRGGLATTATRRRTRQLPRPARSMHWPVSAARELTSGPGAGPTGATPTREGPASYANHGGADELLGAEP